MRAAETDGQKGEISKEVHMIGREKKEKTKAKAFPVSMF
jgi:hypothetical protein